MLDNSPSYATVPTSDFERAKRFYADQLDLTPLEDTPQGAFYETGNTKFFVYPSSGAASGDHTQMGWEVDDIRGTVQDLQSRGVQFEEYDTPYLKTVNGIADQGLVLAAWFRDSEGNLLSIVERRS